MKPRVMVSSVVVGFEEIREAARRGIDAAGGEPILVNEDFPAMVASPRNACLDAVDSSDALLLIIGARAGFTAPSGKSVVEEEYERAIARGKVVIAFLQEGVDREPEAERFAARVSEFVHGHHRSSFSTPDDLQAKVRRAVEPLPQQIQKPDTDLRALSEALAAASQVQGTPLLRTAFATVRDEEVVDAVEIGRPAFHERIVALGIEAGLFSLWHGKDARLNGNRLTVRQEAGNARPVRYARVELSPNGLLVVEGNVTAREEGESPMGMQGLQILERDVAALLREQFRFAGRLYEQVDPYHRQHAVSYNCALVDAGYRMLVKESTRGGGGIRMSMRGDRAVAAHAAPRTIGRAVLESPDAEVERTLELLVRAMNE